MLRKASCCLLLISALLPATGCATDSTLSERQVLPDFNPQEFAQRRLFLAPIPKDEAQGPEASSALDIEALKVLSQELAEPELAVAAQKTFYQGAAASAEHALRESGTGLGLVTIEASRWQSYFENPDAFLNISVDGKTHYEVPPRALLQSLGVDADFVLLMTSLEYSLTITTTKTDNGTSTDRSYNCKSTFVVWDYQRGNVVAEGSVDSSIDFRRQPSIENLKALGGRTVNEILAKRPFKR